MFQEDYTGTGGLPLSSVFQPSPPVVPGGGYPWDDSESSVVNGANAARDGSGNLVLTGRRRGPTVWESVRLDTYGRYQLQYGYLEARMKIPAGKGAWPAFWMLPVSTGYQLGFGGEIDIVETINDGIVYGSVHNWDTPPGFTLSRTTTASYSDGQYHTFGLNWKANSLEFFYDNVSYGTVVPANVSAPWLFNQPYYLLLNLSVGGSWPGATDATTPSPLNLIVDYVKVSAALP